MALNRGSRLGAYEVTGSLGAGGMGEVYRAHDSKLGRDVAIKVLPDSFAADPDRLARFTREARVLASLNHPNIAHVYGIEESNGVAALAERRSGTVLRGARWLSDGGSHGGGRGTFGDRHSRAAFQGTLCAVLRDFTPAIRCLARRREVSARCERRSTDPANYARPELEAGRRAVVAATLLPHA